MELLRIVDSNGKFTGIIMEREEVHEKNFFHNEVAVFIINDDGKVLLGRRSMNKKYSPGKWGLFAGHVIENEALEEAALREVKEELGIEFDFDELIPFSTVEKCVEKTNSHFTYFYYIRANIDLTNCKIGEDEVSEIRWFKIDELIRKTQYKNNDTVLNKNRIGLLKELKRISINFNKNFI